MPGVQRGTVQAFSVETGATQWTYRQAADTTSLLTTAGGLVFGGDQAGRFRALDAASTQWSLQRKQFPAAGR